MCHHFHCLTTATSVAGEPARMDFSMNCGCYGGSGTMSQDMVLNNNFHKHFFCINYVL